jgi:hypothetical protein
MDDAKFGKLPGHPTPDAGRRRGDSNSESDQNNHGPYSDTAGVYPRPIGDDDEDDDTIVDPGNLDFQKAPPTENQAPAQPFSSQPQLHGFDDSDDDDEETLLLPQGLMGTANQPPVSPTAKGGARRLAKQKTSQTTGPDRLPMESAPAQRTAPPPRPISHIRKNSPPSARTSPLPNRPLEDAQNRPSRDAGAQTPGLNQPRKLNDLVIAGSAIDDDHTVSSPRVERNIIRVARDQENANSAEDPFMDQVSVQNLIPPSSHSKGPQGRSDGFDDGPTLPSLQKVVDADFDSISETQVAMHSQTHSLESDEAAPDYADEATSGTLIIYAPENGKVFINGNFQGEGRTTIRNADPFGLYHIRIHCPGFRPWSGTGSLQGKNSLEIKPELKARG